VLGRDVSDSMLYEPHWSAGQAFKSNGSLVNVKYKSYYYVDPKDADWQIQDMTDVFFKSRADFKLNKYMTSEVTVWQDFCELFGYDRHDLFHPSALCHRTIPKLVDPAKSPFAHCIAARVRPTYTGRTEACVVMHVWWATTSGTIDMKLTARAMLEAWLTGAMTSAQMGMVDVRAVGRTHSLLCNRQHLSGECGCMRLRFLSPAFEGHCNPAAKLVNGLVMAAEVGTTCDCALKCFKACVDSVAGFMHKNLEESDKQDVLREVDIDVKGPGGRKRRRIDEDVKHALMSKLVEDSRAPSAGVSVIAAFGQGGRKLTHDWAIADNKLGRLSMKVAFGDTPKGVFSTCPDATRLGHPGKDYVIYPTWGHRSNYGGWLPSQDKSAHFLSRSFLSDIVPWGRGN
jgi:hypothetical protein